jgi:hypothetical protein
MATPMAIISVSKNVPPSEEDVGRNREFEEESLMESTFPQRTMRPENLRIKIESIPEDLLFAIQEIAQDYHDVISINEDAEKQDDDTIIYWRLSFRGLWHNKVGRLLDQGETISHVDKDQLEAHWKPGSMKLSIYHGGIIEGN